MSREIKFRGWHTAANKMFSAEEMAADQLTLLPNGSFINVHGDDVRRSVIYDNTKFIPLQYCGLKDKNGKEIYEGDRLKDSSGYIWIVFWYGDHACFGVMSEENSAGSEIIDNENMEIIGNIYENKQ